MENIAKQIENIFEELKLDQTQIAAIKELGNYNEFVYLEEKGA